MHIDFTTPKGLQSLTSDENKKQIQTGEQEKTGRPERGEKKKD